MQDWLQGGLKISPAMISWPYWWNRCPSARGSSPQARMPHEQTALERQIKAAGRQIDALVYELYGLTEEEMRIAEWGGTRHERWACGTAQLELRQLSLGLVRKETVKIKYL